MALAQQLLHHAPPHVFDVHHAVAEIGVRDAAEGLAVGAQHVLQGQAGVAGVAHRPRAASPGSPCPPGSGCGSGRRTRTRGRSAGPGPRGWRPGGGARRRVPGAGRAPRPRRSRAVRSAAPRGRAGSRAGRCSRCRCRGRSRRRAAPRCARRAARPSSALRCPGSPPRPCRRSITSSASSTRESRRAFITTGEISCAQVWKTSTSWASNWRDSRVWITRTPIGTPRISNGTAIREAKRSSPVSGKYLYWGWLRASWLTTALRCWAARPTSPSPTGSCTTPTERRSRPLVADRVRWVRSASTM